jgi:DNA-binding MarR family transcriptional regulator
MSGVLTISARATFPWGLLNPCTEPRGSPWLRLPGGRVARLQEALGRQSLDLSRTELGVFLFPGPDGRRPSDLARQCAMTRQAMNYVLAGLEERGYIERRDAAVSSGRVVHVTERGRQVIRVLRTEVRQIEREWAAHLGAQRFEALRETLHELASWLG